MSETQNDDFLQEKPIITTDPRLGRIEGVVEAFEGGRVVVRKNFIDLGFERKLEVDNMGDRRVQKSTFKDTDGKVTAVKLEFLRQDNKRVSIFYHPEENPEDNKGTSFRLYAGTLYQPQIIGAHFDSQGLLKAVDAEAMHRADRKISSKEQELMFRLSEWPLTEEQQTRLFDQLGEDARREYEDSLATLQIPTNRITLSDFTDEGFLLKSPTAEGTTPYNQEVTADERKFTVKKEQRGQGGLRYLVITQTIPGTSRAFSVTLPFPDSPSDENVINVKDLLETGWTYLDDEFERSGFEVDKQGVEAVTRQEFRAVGIEI